MAQPGPDPTPTPTPDPGPGPSPGPGIDIGHLIEGIVNGFRDVLVSWATDIPRQVGLSIEGSLRSVWEDFWHSGINILATPRELTIDFPAANVLRLELFGTVLGITMIAIALLGVRMLFQTLTGHGSTMSEIINGILLGIFLSSSSLFMMLLAFNLTIAASNHFGRINYAPAMRGDAWPNLALGLITLLIMLVYGWRLWVRSAYRLVLLMALVPFAPVAGILVAIPQVRWIATLYWVTMGGWLAGGFLAITVLSLGLQLATVGNINGIVSLVFSVALVQLAHDVMGLLPKAFVGSGLSGSPAGKFFIGGSVGSAAVAAGAVGGAVVGAAAATGTAVGSLPAGDQAGYGY